MELFEKYNAIPSTKQMTFLKTKQFTVQAKTDESAATESSGHVDIDLYQPSRKAKTAQRQSEGEIEPERLS